MHLWDHLAGFTCSSILCCQVLCQSHNRTVIEIHWEGHLNLDMDLIYTGSYMKVTDILSDYVCFGDGGPQGPCTVS